MKFGLLLLFLLLLIYQVALCPSQNLTALQHLSEKLLTWGAQALMQCVCLGVGAGWDVLQKSSSL